MTREQAEIEVPEILQALERAGGCAVRSIEITSMGIAQVSFVGEPSSQSLQHLATTAPSWPTMPALM